MEEVDDYLNTLLSEQSLDLIAAESLDSDLAYQLQIQEAMTASLSQSGEDVPSSSNAAVFLDDAVPKDFAVDAVPKDFAVDEIYVHQQQLLDQMVAEEEMRKIFLDDAVPKDFAVDAVRLFDDEIDDEICVHEQQLIDQMFAEEQMSKIRDDLNRSIHDHAFAREIHTLPNEEWEKIGDNIQKPYLGGSAFGTDVAVTSEDYFRVHVKGLMGGNGTRNTFVGGIGVAVCDMNDSLVFEVGKRVAGVEMSGEVVEVKAFIEGLHVATILGLKRTLIVCDSNLIHQCFTGKWRPAEGNLATLVDQAKLLLRNLTDCYLSLVAQKDVKFALKLAQDAIVSQADELVENSGGKEVIETCAICLEDINTNQMFSINGCLHRYCFSCMKRHVEVKLLCGMLPECPNEQCKLQLKTDDCRKFLTPKLFDIMNQRTMEASIPAANRVYCPYLACSMLMSRSELVHGGLTSGMVMCKKCNRPFCVNCKVIWHDNMTCSVYKQQNPNPSPEDENLKSLATKSLWRQCSVCNYMVSLGEGCNHIYCRCGHQFCYICGAPWVNKKATCSCPLWDERNIVYER